ncbi:hypothetical protein BU23DRAFT_580108 [Bimuria novae-zelandiae CBS 107.79]|uniref:Uncharacterized protein n=1 Tax=Bimuria novae-zelandiae CBS 107.79 TaxID=1447943 RepID=A0A6A5VFS5_9PLEO|nr:hypothetical protein BU23DRAFT_580108 [Bimuria novae-zelandiae CBS 107.79]
MPISDRPKRAFSGAENGPVKFWATQVKPYYRAENEEQSEVAPHDLLVKDIRGRRRLRKNPEKDNYTLVIKLRVDSVITTPREPFKELDYTEMESLIAGGTFKVLIYDLSIHKGRIFNLRLVREIKGKSTQPYEKSRLVFAGHSDEEKKEILTQSPTIQRMSQRLILAIGPSLMASYGMHCELRDITQAYVQLTDRLTQTLFARPPRELRESFPPRTIFRVVRPLYGAAESGLY